MGSKLVHFSVINFPGARVIGKSTFVKMEIALDDPTIENLWASMKKDGSLDALLALPDRFTKDPDTVGWMGDVQPGGDAYIYLAGVLFKPNTAVPEGFISRDIVPCEMAYGWIQGTDDDEGGDMMANASGHVSKAAKEHGYEYDGSKGGFEMECYSYERFRGPEQRQRGEKFILDFYSPCKKAS